MQYQVILGGVHAEYAVKAVLPSLYKVLVDPLQKTVRVPVTDVLKRLI